MTQSRLLVGHRRYKRTKVPPTQFNFEALSSYNASQAAAAVVSVATLVTDLTVATTITHIRSIGSSRSS